MSWLRSLFAQDDEVTRLKADCNTHLAHIAELKTKLEASEARLFAEIDSNREQTDSLVAQIVAVAGGIERFAPARTLLNAKERKAELEAGDIEPVEDADLELERAITQRADEFVANAASRGFAYSPTDVDVLKENIRRNPSEYLEN